MYLLMGIDREARLAIVRRMTDSRVIHLPLERLPYVYHERREYSLEDSTQDGREMVQRPGDRKDGPRLHPDNG